jgi:hypothetical protein
MLLVPHASDDMEAQVPLLEYNCMIGLLLARPEPVMLAEKLVPVAVILYQTSSSGLPEHTVATPLDVAFQTVPELLVVPLVSVVAPLQSSFDGGGVYVTQISKSHLLALPDDANDVYTLT